MLAGCRSGTRPQSTWTEGVADARQLRLKVPNLSGKILQDVTLKALS
jgi:hypothetical protein